MKGGKALYGMLSTRLGAAPAWGWLALAGGLLLLCVGLNAWVSDDAFITFRTVFNLTRGDGPVYNVGERVQTFTNPLWMFLMSILYLFTGEAYFTSIALSLFFLVAGVWVLCRRVMDSGWGAVAMMLTMALSQSFVHYSTSGLENVLNFFILSWFLSIWIGNGPRRGKVFWLALIMGIGMFSRLDTMLLYAPVVVWAWWGQRSWRASLDVVAGLTPILAWEFFSVVYYGFPFPNTAYAKLNSGLSDAQMFIQGFHYYFYTLRHDPMTLGVMMAGMFAALSIRKSRYVPLALGLILYMGYVMRIGGDFMAGRFMYLPFVLGLVLLVESMREKMLWKWVWLGMLLIGFLNPEAPPYRIHENIEEPQPWENGIANERRWYYDATALIDLSHDDWVLKAERDLDEALTKDTTRKVLVWECIGIAGYGAGPSFHVVDQFALADPMMARLPMAYREDWRIGHFERVYPYGYIRTLRKRLNLLEDPALRDYYDMLQIVVSGPVWSMDRFKAIWAFNTGKMEDHIDHDFYRFPAPSKTKLGDLGMDRFTASGPMKQPSSFGQAGVLPIFVKRPLTVELPETMHNESFSLGLISRAQYVFSYLQDGVKLGSDTLRTKWVTEDSAVVDTLHVNPAFSKSGYNGVLIDAGLGNDHYGIWHMSPLSPVK